jgi:hypothetical protein
MTRCELLVEGRLRSLYFSGYPPNFARLSLSPVSAGISTRWLGMPQVAPPEEPRRNRFASLQLVVPVFCIVTLTGYTCPGTMGPGTLCDTKAELSVPLIATDTLARHGSSFLVSAVAPRSLRQESPRVCAVSYAESFAVTATRILAARPAARHRKTRSASTSLKP